jgi:F-type H+-transporting ATPase subunit epsilon
VLEGHGPIMSTLRSDATLDIYATQGAVPEKLSIAGGFAEVNENGLTVLAERVVESA